MLSLIFYNIFLLLYKAAIRVASLWNKKAKLWIGGRKNIFSRLQAKLNTDKSSDENSNLIWFHCSSLGEFEQGRPVLEKLKTKYRQSKVLLTFFSPSGYEIRKDYSGADWVFYLPADSKTNARKFLDIINPSLVVFVKYDYWYYYLTECRKRNIPLLMISAIFRNNQPFFKWYGNLHKKMLSCFTHFFVQDDNSKDLLQRLQISEVTVAGDTRFDRVAEIAEKFEPIPEIEEFCGNDSVFVAGSTWPKDEKIIRQAALSVPGLKIIIVPHEVGEEHLRKTKLLFPESLLYSELKTSELPVRQADSLFPTPDSRLPTHDSQLILIIDTIGILSKLYKYATITYIGGGFNKGIHNTLEAAVHGKPVIFGPHHEKFREAIDLKENGGGICINNSAELTQWLVKLRADRADYDKRCKNSQEYVQQKRGAAEKIIRYIQENRLLTN